MRGFMKLFGSFLFLMALLCIFPLNAYASPTQKELDAKLLEAAENGTPEMIEELIALGADMNATNSKGETPLDIAAGKLKHIQMLAYWGAREHWVRYNQEIKLLDAKLFEATRTSTPEKIQELLDSGANIHAKDHEGREPIHMAASLGTPEKIQKLYDLGADLNVTDNKGRTPLDMASFENRSILIRMRARHGSGCY